MIKDSAAILEKARNTEYKHPKWFKDSGKSVYDAVDYFVKFGDFYIDLVSTLTSVDMIPNYDGPKPCSDKRTIISYCLKNDLYDYLVIRYSGRGKGTDTGKLKIQTFIILLAEFKGTQNWTKEEVTILRRYYSKGFEELEYRLIGRSLDAIRTKAVQLGLRIPK